MPRKKSVTAVAAATAAAPAAKKRSLLDDDSDGDEGAPALGRGAAADDAAPLRINDAFARRFQARRRSCCLLRA
jgi:long-subunit fatty acid transport protein